MTRIGQINPAVKCGDCGAPMLLRQSATNDRLFYGCSRFPRCKGRVGAQLDGSPVGDAVDEATRRARQKAHAAIDELMKIYPPRKRGSQRKVFMDWLAVKLPMDDGLNLQRCNMAQCERVIKLCKWRAENPAAGLWSAA